MTKHRKGTSSRLVRLGHVAVETKGDVGEQSDGIQLQKFDPPRLSAD